MDTPTQRKKKLIINLNCDQLKVITWYKYPTNKIM